MCDYDIEGCGREWHGSHGSSWENAWPILPASRRPSQHHASPPVEWKLKVHPPSQNSGEGGRRRTKSCSSSYSTWWLTVHCSQMNKEVVEEVRLGCVVEPGLVGKWSRSRHNSVATSSISKGKPTISSGMISIAMVNFMNCLWCLGASFTWFNKFGRNEYIQYSLLSNLSTTYIVYFQ